MTQRSRIGEWVAVTLFAALAVAVRVWFVRHDVAWLAEHVVPDAAAYDFVLARRLAAGVGFNWLPDLPALTTSPLWLALLYPIFSAFDGETAVQLAAGLSGVFAFVAAGLVFVLARRLTASRIWAYAAAAFFLFSPLALLDGLDATSASLGLALGLALLVATTAPKPWPAWLRGLLGAAAMLAAPSEVPLVLAAWMWSLWHSPRRGREALALLGIGLVPPAAWLVFVGVNLEFLPWRALAGFPLPAAGSTLVALGLSLPNAVSAVLPEAAASVWGLLLVAAALVVAWRRREGAAAMWLLLGASAVWWLLSAWVVNGVAEVSALPITAAFALLVAWFAAATWRRLARTGAWVLALIAVVWLVVSAYEWKELAHHGRTASARELAAAGLWIHQAPINNGVYAGFDVGWISFLSGKAVHELGGRVNMAAWTALNNGRLEPYLRAQRVSLLADTEGALRFHRDLFEDSLPMRIKEIARIDLNVAPGRAPFVSLYAYAPDKPPTSDKLPIDLDIGLNDDAHILDGFYPAERDSRGVTFRWSRGSSSLIGFYLDHANDRPLQMILRVAPFVAPGDAKMPLGVDVAVNGTLIGRLSVPRLKPGFNDAGLVLPLHVLKRGFNRLAFRYDDVQTPAQPSDLEVVETSPYRELSELALAFDRLTITVPTAPAQEP